MESEPPVLLFSTDPSHPIGRIATAKVAIKICGLTIFASFIVKLNQST